jgi:methylenetetrahydrofolate dehydrogenase (NADP+)/methenyltetrahydrofolate cyclohydrolase
MSLILDGVNVQTKILNDLSQLISAEYDCSNQRPGLAVILVGDDPASKIYVERKKATCQKIGITSYEHRLPKDTSESTLSQLISQLNRDPMVHGILLQVPLPNGLNETRLLDLISPHKDVDGFHPDNVGKLLLGRPVFQSCTPYGVCELLRHYNIETNGKQCVILGRSNIVGKPLAAMLMQDGNPGNATVTVCHSRTSHLEKITAQADILIAAIGKPEFVKKHMIKKGAVVIDVGVNRISDSTKTSGFKLVGDVDFENAAKHASAITPVPGGVGPMTIAMLMKNTVKAFQTQLTNSVTKTKTQTSLTP